MLQNVNPQQMYLPQPQEYVPPMAMASPPQYMPQPIAVPPGVMPVYNSIPYNSVYAPCCQSQGVSGSSPHISTVSIEMNGIQPPNLQGLNGSQGQIVPNYMAAPVGTQSIPSNIPPYAMVGAMPQSVQPQEITPPPPAIENGVKVSAAPVSAPQADQTVKQAAAEPASQTNEQEAIKPLIEALNIIVPQKGAPEPSFEAQEKAIQTVAQFARVAEASNQLIKQNPDAPESKQTKEKVDKLIKPNLIKEETFMGLADIMLKDTSKLNGEDKKKADQNRIYGMWTLAMLQKLFKEEMNTEAKKINIPPVSMGEIPGISQVSGIAIGDKQKNIKPDSSPDMREAAIAALVNIADVQDKKDVEIMKAILTEAQKDPDKKVKDAASEALKMYPAEKAPVQAQAVKK